MAPSRSKEARIARAAADLAEAEQAARPLALLSASWPDLGESDAYRIQARRLELRGRRAVGFKLGFTSAAMRAQMHIKHPNYGVLTDDLRIENPDGRIDTARLIHPRVEPEIALLTARDLVGPGIGRAEVFDRLEAIMPAIEIVDTRYQDYTFKAEDNIADNSSSARFLTGPAKSIGAVSDPRLIEVGLYCDGRSIATGSGADALGDPLDALAWLANFLAASGRSVPAGSVILTGGLTRAFAAKAGQTFTAEFSELGSVSVKFV